MHIRQRNTTQKSSRFRESGQGVSHTDCSLAPCLAGRGVSLALFKEERLYGLRPKCCKGIKRCLAWPSKRHVSTGCLDAFKGLCAEQQAYLLCLHTPNLMQATAADGSLHSVKPRCVLHTYAVHLKTLIAVCY